MPLRNIVNREAKGFLSLFRAKVGGQGPKLFTSDVHPQVDVLPFFAAGMMVTRTQSITSTSNTTEIAVPSDEVWLIHQCNASIEHLMVGAGYIQTKLYFADVRNGTGGAAIDHVLDLRSVNGAAGERLTDTVSFNPGSPFILAPGAGVGAGINASESSFLKLSVLYTPLDV